MPALELDNEIATDARLGTGHQTIRNCVERAAHLLPAQGPIEVFVHHNTLHAFEDQSFHEAVLAGCQRYNAEPYLSEQEYRRLYQSGRISDDDLEAAVKEDLGDLGSEEINGLGTRTEIRFAMLRHPLHIGPDAELRWVVAETDALERFREQTTEINRTRIITSARKWLEDSTDSASLDADLNALLTKFGPNVTRWTEGAWESFSLHLIWRICLGKGTSSPSTTRHADFLRPRDLLLHATGRDIDGEVQDVLIRFCAAYVDQGYSDWLLPNRNHGFFESFLSLYGTKSRGLDRWLRRLPEELSSLRNNDASAEASIEASLRELGIHERHYEEFISQSLLALGGWAGMIWQLESSVDWVVHSIPKGSLIGMLAVQLILEKHAIRHLGKEEFGEPSSIESILTSARARLREPQPLNEERRAFLLFQVAQMLGWTPLELLQLTEQQWQDLSHEIESFTAIERRRTFHEAYERQYRHAALDAFAIHSARRRQIPATWTGRPNFQMITCIDDREESFRRHLEEVEPECETFGAAGFFGVAMYYRGASAAHFRPLCPAVIKPQHYVCEDVGYTFQGRHQVRATARRKLGRATHSFHLMSRTFLGGILAGLVGAAASIPMVARVLWPRLTARVRALFGRAIQHPPVTQLRLDRYREPPGSEEGHIGYTLEEMDEIVAGLLTGIGLTSGMSRIVVVCGHGSASWNNPHEAAHDCGACGGGRGGPNARAFAQMANDLRVRGRLSKRGLSIPEDTVFLGAYHNTCDDSVVWYDLDRLPPSHRAEFESLQQSVEVARRRDSHERCRRFYSAKLDISPDEALAHVEGRAENLAQVRPEFGHATNSICCVGNRNWSRGLFLDRRAFLTSYRSDLDNANSEVLERLLQAVIPVCAGISLEYYFSTVDPESFGCGTKLPHNISGLLGVMNGPCSDLRTGLPWQMVEIHEPVRLTFVIETTPQAMLSIMDRNAAIQRLVRGEWVHLALIDPVTSTIQVFRDGDFHVYEPSASELVEAASSLECYKGSRDHLPFFSIRETEVSS